MVGDGGGSRWIAVDGVDGQTGLDGRDGLDVGPGRVEVWTTVWLELGDVLSLRVTRCESRSCELRVARRFQY